MWRRILLAVATLLIAASAASSARADPAQQCPASNVIPRGTLTLTWSNCPSAAPVRPKPHVVRRRRPVHHYVEHYAPPPQPYYPPPQQTYYPPAPLPQPVAGCPSGFSLTIYAWDMNSISPDLRVRAEGLIQAAMGRFTEHGSLLTPYAPDDVSRTLGGDIRRTGIPPANVSGYVQVNYLDPNEPTHVVRYIGYFPIRAAADRSVAHIPLPGDPRNYVVETIFPEYFVSPTAQDRTGPRRLRLLRREWRGAFTCNMPETGLVPGSPPRYGTQSEESSWR